MKNFFKHKTTFDIKFYYLIILNVILMCYSSNIFLYGTNQEIFKKIIGHYLCFNFGFFGLIYVVLSFVSSKKIVSFITNTIVVFSIFLACIEIFLATQFNSLMDAHFIDIFLSTDFNEAREFLGFYINLNPFNGGKASYITYSIILFILISIFLLKIKITTKFHSLPFIIIAGLCFWFNLTRYSNTNSIFRIINSLSSIHSEPMHLSLEHDKFLKSMQSSIDTMKHNLQNNIKHDLPPKVVLIIGESTQRGYMGIYGFNLPTTPNLEKLKIDSNLFVFNDIISPATTTNASLEKVLTMSSYENSHIPWYMNFNIIDLMKIAGYKTIWISNQMGYHIHDAVGTSIARTSDISRLNGGAGYDGELLPIFDSIKNYSNANFYVFHLLGTHLQYKKRYPKEYKYFADKEIKNIQTKQYNPTQVELTIKADYLNAILYNDFIVSSIIEKFKDDNAIIFYLSDHGEEVYDFRSFAGHGTKDSRFSLEIPFIIYVSDTYKKLYPHKVELIKNSLNKPQMSDDFIHSFLDILDIRIGGFDSTKSIFNDKYNINRKRFIYDKIDYDKELKNNY